MLSVTEVWIWDSEVGHVSLRARFCVTTPAVFDQDLQYLGQRDWEDLTSTCPNYY